MCPQRGVLAKACQRRTAPAPLRQHAVKPDLAQHAQRRRHMPVPQAAQQLQSRRLITAQHLVAQQPPQRYDLGRRPVRDVGRAS
jgi:hypothetical protein